MKVTSRQVDKYTQVIEFDAVCPDCGEQVQITDHCPDTVITDPITVAIEVACGCSHGHLHLVSKGGGVLPPEIAEAIEDFESLDGGCSCHMGNPPCGWCTHPGNIDNPEEFYL